MDDTDDNSSSTPSGHIPTDEPNFELEASEASDRGTDDVNVEEDVHSSTTTTNKEGPNIELETSGAPDKDTDDVNVVEIDRDTDDNENEDRHSVVRKRAYRKTVEAAERMEHFYNKKKRIKIATFNIGDTVSVAIPKLDRASIDLKRVPAIVTHVHGTKRPNYSLATQFGRLKSKFLAGDLEKFMGVVVPELQHELTLREAARRHHPENLFTKSFCDCASGCASKRCPCLAKNIKCSTHCHSATTCKNKEGPQILGLQQSVSLTERDNDDLKSTSSFLNDNHINAAQRILKNQFPEASGLQDTLLQQNSSFDVLKGPFVQIIHTHNHWITVARSDNDQVKIYDSLRQAPSNDTMETVAKLIMSDHDDIEFTVMHTQLQGENPDCGAFAVAFATSLLFGEDPTQLEYDETTVRDHLRQCLTNQNFAPFPSKPHFRSSAFVTSSQLQIYCLCRCPDNGTMMIECEKCQMWFHAHCVGLRTQRQRKEAANSWVCTKCAKQ